LARKKQSGLNYQRYCGLTGVHLSSPLGSRHIISLMTLNAMLLVEVGKPTLFFHPNFEKGFFKIFVSIVWG